MCRRKLRSKHLRIFSENSIKIHAVIFFKKKLRHNIADRLKNKPREFQLCCYSQDYYTFKRKESFVKE